MKKKITPFEAFLEELEEHGIFLLCQSENFSVVGNRGESLTRQIENLDLFSKDPLDTWTRQVVGDAAKRWAQEVHYPFDGPPYIPITKYMLDSGAYTRSPLLIAFHHYYGLWTAARAVVVHKDEKFEKVLLPPFGCQTCTTRECLNSCPVRAVTENGILQDICHTHLLSTDGPCLTYGCLARNACPYGESYSQTQKKFHMNAFIKLLKERLPQDK